MSTIQEAVQEISDLFTERETLRVQVEELTARNEELEDQAKLESERGNKTTEEIRELESQIVDLKAEAAKPNEATGPSKTEVVEPKSKPVVTKANKA